MTSVPLFSFPLMVTLIDDDPLLLRTLTTLLRENHALKIFNDPRQALNFFSTYNSPLSSLKLLRGYKESEHYDLLGHLPVDLNLNELKIFIENPERINEIGLIVIDYNMPQMNGIEVCRKLKSLPIKKILLTGESNDQLAIDAFNEGIIDCFIRKDSTTLATDLLFHATRLARDYLFRSTAHLLRHLEIDQPLPISDPDLIKAFEEFCHSNNIKEHFVIDQKGNLLLINNKNKHSFFVVHTDCSLDAFVELHEDDEDARPLLRSIQQREKIPYFGDDKESWRFKPTEWDKYLKTPEVINGKEKYYWAVF